MRWGALAWACALPLPPFHCHCRADRVSGRCRWRGRSDMPLALAALACFGRPCLQRAFAALACCPTCMRPVRRTQRKAGWRRWRRWGGRRLYKACRKSWCTTATPSAWAVPTSCAGLSPRYAPVVVGLFCHCSRPLLHVTVGLCCRRAQHPRLLSRSLLGAQVCFSLCVCVCVCVCVCKYTYAYTYTYTYT